MSVQRVAVVQRNVNDTGSLARDALLLVRELLALGVEVHVYCNPATRTSSLPGATFHDVRPIGGRGRAVEIASFAAAATRAVARDRRRYDVVDVDGVAAWCGDVVCVHEVVRAAQLRWPHEGGAGRRAARARAAVAPFAHPAVGVASAIQFRQFHPLAFAGAIVINDEMRDDLVRVHGIAEDRVAVVPLAVELARVDDDGVRASLALAPETPLLLFVGDAFRRKGLDVAVDALRDLPYAHLAVLGAPGTREQDDAEAHARSAGVSRRVHFVGRVDPAPYYAAADAFVLPTTHDAWANPVVEALAAGVPVVTTAAAGSASLVRETRTGVVLDRATPGSVAAAVRAILAAPAPRASPATLSRYTPRARAEATLDAYERLLASRVRSIASFPSVQAMNPYQRLFYRHLAADGIELVDGARFSLPWLVRGRRSVDALHVHWPENMYTLQRGPAWARGPGSWAKLGAFALRLGAARRLGYRVAWTIHQPLPHARSPRDGPAARLLARRADVLLAHDEATRARAADLLGVDAARIELIPHGSYLGVYPAGRSRAEVRAGLGIAGDAFVFLAFGELRARKCWRRIVRAFRTLGGDDLALVVAGLAKDPSTRAAIEQAVSGDARIRLLLDYVPDERVAELFDAADAAVLARDDGGTSGSLVLPLSLGVPVVAADRPAYRALTHGEEAGWLFDPDDDDALRDALERAASDRDAARARGRAAARIAAMLDWAPAAERAASALRASR